MGQQKQKQNKEVIDPIEQKALKDALNRFYQNRENGDVENTINKNASTQTGTPIQSPQQPTPQQYQPLDTQPHPRTVVPTPQNVNMSGFQTPEEFEKTIYKQGNVNLDPNLTVGYELVPFPSRGLYYSSKIGDVTVEYMTSKDEDILSTSSLIENGTVLDILLKNKIKTPGINTDELLVGDRNAVLLFLRASSYGQEYEVRVTDPRTGIPFTSTVDLTTLKPKSIKFLPDEHGEFSFILPKRNLMVKFKILNYKEINHVLKTAEAKQEAYSLDYSEFGSLKLKAEVVEVAGNRNKDYIVQFIDALPARDSSILKQRINDVTPDVDMNYEFTAADGFKFKAKITVGVDFFFPFI